MILWHEKLNNYLTQMCVENTQMCVILPMSIFIGEITHFFVVEKRRETL